MAALLLEIKEGDEVIMPSYTFVSTADAFALRGAKIVLKASGLNSLYASGGGVIVSYDK
jgi:dTDP-4-amino-4,6-dideoxygalactose transaminase